MSYIRILAKAIRAEVPAELVPPDADDLFLVYAALAAAKGDRVGAEDVHHAWVAWMEMRGETHQSMVTFSRLPEAVRDEDDPFVRAIRLALNRVRPVT